MVEINPLLLAKAAPYAIAALIAFALAWGIQSLRLTSAKLEVKEVQQEYTAFRQEQTRIFQEHRDAADKQRKESDLAYEAAKKQLADNIETGAVYRRCVLAVRCGPTSVGVCKQPTNTTGIGISAPRKPDDPGQNELPLAGNDAAINDCAVTTLQLNSLQADIEAQPGYKE